MKTLPRRDLREAAFRRYEADIARATRETFIKKPEKVSPLTYIARFRDAILGFKEYKYQSFVVPEDFNFSLIKLSETSDGSVIVKNLAAAKAGTATVQRERVEEAVRAKSVEGGDLPLRVAYNTEEEKKWLLSLEEKYDIAAREGNGEIEFY